MLKPISMENGITKRFDLFFYGCHPIPPNDRSPSDSLPNIAPPMLPQEIKDNKELLLKGKVPYK